ncbi:Dynein heavy chain 2, axonemal [Larimichthys crocea]|uniref:Uncharacterized protein n=1 Tax=Larimichthys crocea TaxID=215358 RepID=A0ACD3Q566_LARCR|nr:Dynein heavy chain 2, axonemal [Larimichthys crocea]
MSQSASTIKLSPLTPYYIPRDGPQSSYMEYISALPSTEHPEVFGQHFNADIASQIAETRTLFDTLLSLQPQVTNPSAAGARPSREDKVLELLADIRGKIPVLIDYERTRSLLQDNPSPLNVVLLQEIQRYNSLLDTIMSIARLLGLLPPAELLYSADHLAYPSLKPLAAWTRDLCQRVNQFARWAETAQPPNLFWLSGFTFPNGFLTAVLQSSARQHNISVDTLSWEFIVSTLDDSNLLYPPKDGVFIRGLYLEGAGWDKKNSCLVEAEPMQMVCPIPTIHFKPVENRKKTSKRRNSLREGRSGVGDVAIAPIAFISVTRFLKKNARENVAMDRVRGCDTQRVVAIFFFRRFLGLNRGLLNEMRARWCRRKECRIFFLKCHVVKLWRVLYYFQEERLNSLPFGFFPPVSTPLLAVPLALRGSYH